MTIEFLGVTSRYHRVAHPVPLGATSAVTAAWPELQATEQILLLLSYPVLGLGHPDVGRHEIARPSLA